VEPAYYGSDEPRSPGDAPQVGDLFSFYFIFLSYPAIRLCSCNQY